MYITEFITVMGILCALCVIASIFLALALLWVISCYVKRASETLGYVAEFLYRWSKQEQCRVGDAEVGIKH